MMDPVFEPLTMKVDFQLEMLGGLDHWKPLFSRFFSELAKALTDSDPCLIGHLKGFAPVVPDGFIKVSITGTHEKADIQGRMQKPVKCLTLTLNVLVYGLNRLQLSILLKQVIKNYSKNKEKNMENNLKERFANLDEAGVLELVKKGIDENVDPEIVLSACQDAMRVVGEKFEQGTYFVSDLMLSGVLFKQVNELLAPLIKSDGTDTSRGKVVIGTVAGDIHDIGKDLVVALLEANNFDVHDIGVDQPKEVFIEKIKETGAKVVGMSGLLTIAFDAMKETIAAIEAQGLRDEVKIMIGGGPVNRGVCDYVGADHWADNAQGAISFCNQLYSS